MPGYLLHQGAKVICMHSGQAQAGVPNARVKVSNQATALQPTPWSIAGCIFNVSGSPSPCVSAQWLSAATRVRSNKVPLLLADSKATCAPNGTGVQILVTQIRVKGK